MFRTSIILASAIAFQNSFAASITIENIASKILELGDRQVVDVKIFSSEDFSASPIEVVLDRTKLDNVDVDKDVELNLNPAVFPIGRNETKTIQLIIKANTMSASFEAVGLSLVAKNRGEPLAAQDFEVSLKPIRTVFLSGGTAPEKWSSEKKESFRKHTSPIVVRFVNGDKIARHLVHGAGAIPHASKSLEPATESKMGGVYEIKISPQDVPSKGVYYCHDHENGALAREMIFNAKR